LCRSRQNIKYIQQNFLIADHFHKFRVTAVGRTDPAGLCNVAFAQKFLERGVKFAPGLISHLTGLSVDETAQQFDSYTGFTGKFTEGRFSIIFG
jgi:hypothetical protein